ncbi:MAG: geranylgeranylglycerol-phosphate geranylgeranyltransferase [Bacteroidota bacterium]
MTSPAPIPVITVIRLTRAWNIIIVVIAQYAAAGFLIGVETIADPLLVVLSISTGLVAASGYVINDYFDVKIDLINKPDKVLVGTDVSRRKAIFLHSFLATAGTIAGLVIDWRLAFINAVSAFLLWWYSSTLKRAPFVGNLAIAVLTGLSLMVLYIRYPEAGPRIMYYAVFAFTVTLIREAVKDMEDVRGDQAFGCRTLPIIWGIAKTKFYTAVLILMLMGAIVLVHLRFMPLPVSYFLALVMLPLGLFSWRLMRADTTREFQQLSSWCKYIMLLGISSMAAL